MNLKEINRLIASLINSGEVENHTLIEFYRMRRQELILSIRKDVLNKLMSC